MTCGECGSKNITRQNVKGRNFRWKDYSSIKNSQDLDLLVCNSCKNIITKAGESVLIDNAIKASITEQIVLAISKIKSINKCEQQEIARRLGNTPEYLSEVKNGHSIPSFQFFNFLKTMAMDDRRTFEAANPDIQIDIDYKAAMVIQQRI